MKYIIIHICIFFIYSLIIVSLKSSGPNEHKKLKKEILFDVKVGSSYFKDKQFFSINFIRFFIRKTFLFGGNSISQTPILLLTLGFSRNNSSQKLWFSRVKSSPWNSESNVCNVKKIHYRFRTLSFSLLLKFWVMFSTATDFTAFWSNGKTCLRIQCIPILPEKIVHKSAPLFLSSLFWK